MKSTYAVKGSHAGEDTYSKEGKFAIIVQMVREKTFRIKRTHAIKFTLSAKWAHATKGTLAVKSTLALKHTLTL